ncbi:threonylcarbamoyl-AMP synthase [Methanosarcinales archaeon]|nr:MAG: threonylcarbamoyl-AMP synthase [Methanosarcinales archaeon]
MGFLVRLAGKEEKDVKFFLEIAIDYIIEGKVIAFSTNSVYGIGGDPCNIDVINRIYDIKFRDKSKGLLILVADKEEAEKVAIFNPIAERLAEKYWPGQLTLILNKREGDFLPPELTAFRETIGIRVPENPIILKLLKLLKSKGRFGGLIGTSANYSGEPPAISGDDVVNKLLSPIDLILDGGKSKSKIPTTIVDCTSDKVKFLRIGLISEEEIREYLNLENQEEIGDNDE